MQYKFGYILFQYYIVFFKFIIVNECLPSLTLVPACWLVEMGAEGPSAWTLWAAGEDGRTSRVNALLSTAKAAVGSEAGHKITVEVVVVMTG